MGISIASQKMKNRNRSRATKTPIIPVSSSSMQMLNAFTRCLIPAHEPTSAIGVRNVVRSTSHTLMPSTPTWYDVP